MASVNPNSSPFNPGVVDEVGVSNIGTQSSGWTLGSKWQMAIAVPIRNRKFEFGTPIQYAIGEDGFERAGVDPYDTQFGIEGLSGDNTDMPSAYIQHGDKAFIGPSTKEGYETYSEVIRVMAANQVLSNNSNWLSGVIHTLDRSNLYAYSAGDPVTVYGTGVAQAWTPRDIRITPLGIQKGYSSLNHLGMYTPAAVADISNLESALSGTVQNLLVLGVRLPSSGSWSAASSASGHTAIFNSLAGLGPWRDPATFDTDSVDWAHSITATAKGLFRYIQNKAISSVAQLVYSTEALVGSINFAQLIHAPIVTGLYHPGGQYNAYAQGLMSMVNRYSVPSSAVNASGYINIGSGFTAASTSQSYIDFAAAQFGVNVPVLVPAGTYTANSLALLVRDALNSYSSFNTIYQAYVDVSSPSRVYIRAIKYGSTYNSTISVTGILNTSGTLTLSNVANGGNSGTSLISTGLFYQDLSKDSYEKSNPSNTVLYPGTYYRMGLTWKGDLLPNDNLNTDGSEFFAVFKWSNLLVTGTQDYYPLGMMSTSALLNKNNRTQSDWTTHMVSGFVPMNAIDNLDSKAAQRVQLVLKAQSPTSYTSSRDGRGAEMKVFVDNLWLEHQGDIEQSGNPGYIEIDHYPEQGTLTTNKIQPQGAVPLLMSNGETVYVDTNTMARKELWVIEADFVRVTKAVWDKFQALLRWQDMGNNLTLHPFLAGVPHCLVGRMEISNVQKEFWDLNRFTFRVSFREVE